MLPLAVHCYTHTANIEAHKVKTRTQNRRLAAHTHTITHALFPWVSLSPTHISTVWEWQSCMWCMLCVCEGWRGDKTIMRGNGGGVLTQLAWHSHTPILTAPHTTLRQAYILMMYLDSFPRLKSLCLRVWVAVCLDLLSYYCLMHVHAVTKQRETTTLLHTITHTLAPLSTLILTTLHHS